MDVVTVIKEHPLSIIAAAVVILVIVSSSRGSTGGNSGALAATLQSQSVASQANTAIAQINAGVDIARGAQNADMYKAAVSAAAISAAQRTALVSSMFDTSTKTSATLAGLDIQSQVQQTLARFQHLDNQATISNQLALGNKAIDAATLQNAQKMQTAIAINQDDNNTKLNALGQNFNSQYRLAQLTGANLPIILQSQQEMARIAGSNAQAIASINTQAIRTAATVNAAKDGVGIFKDFFGGGNSNGGGGNGDGGSDTDWMATAATIASFFI